MYQDIAQRRLPLEQRAFADFAQHLLIHPDHMAMLRDRLERSPRITLHRLLQLTEDEERNLLAASDAGVALAVAPLINMLGTTLAVKISNGFATESQDHPSRSATIGYPILHTGSSLIHFIDPWLAMDLIVLLASRGINPTNDALDDLYDSMMGIQT